MDTVAPLISPEKGFVFMVVFATTWILTQRGVELQHIGTDAFLVFVSPVSWVGTRALVLTVAEFPTTPTKINLPIALELLVTGLFGRGPDPNRGNQTRHVPFVRSPASVNGECRRLRSRKIRKKGST